MNHKQPAGHTFLHPENILKEIGLSIGETIADFGCGGGYFVIPAAKIIGDDGVAYGVDVLKNALSSLDVKSRMFGLTNVKPVWANVEIFGASRGIHDNILDMVFLVQIMSQSKKRREIFKEVDRVLKHNGGKIMVIDWKSDKLSFSPNPASMTKPEEIKEIAKSFGLILEKEFEPSDYHFGLLLKRA
ncbi:MAG: class I SAM-dependent methyltransferase [Candidatus Kerfeldbacteria bacterium]|jgi:ubiquinone/menaquinone biosynthesis C-methylase UbiE